MTVLRGAAFESRKARLRLRKVQCARERRACGSSRCSVGGRCRTKNDPNNWISLNLRCWPERRASRIIRRHMTRVVHPFRFLLIAVGGWMNESQLQMIEYLREEGRV